MASPFLYDLKRTLTSKTVLIIMAVMILLSLISFPSFIGTANLPLPNDGSTNQLFVYYDSDGYHFTAFSWDQFGRPVNGTIFNVGIVVPNVSSIIISGSGVTNSSGSTQFTIDVPEDSSYTIDVKVTSLSSGVVVNDTYTPFSGVPTPGQTISVFGETRYFAPATPTTVIDSSNASSRDILVSWAGLDCSSPVGDKVYYEFIAGTQTSQSTAFVYQSTGVSSESSIPSELNQTNAQLLGTMSSYLQVFHAPQLEGNISDPGDTILVIGLTDPNGTSIAGSIYSLPISQIYPEVGSALASENANEVAVSYFEDIYGLFIPLMAIVATYNIYGKDRISGVLESVIAQPITRKELPLSRFVSAFIGMSVALLASVAVMDLIAYDFSKAYIDPSIIVFSTLALMVEIAAFIGIMMLLSHLVRSSGVLIGLGVGLFVVIGFFQGLFITLLASMLGISDGSVGYYQVSVALQFINPAQFVSLVDTYLTGTYSTAFLMIPTGSFSMIPGEYGISIPTIIATAIFWVFVPLAILLYLATRRD